MDIMNRKTIENLAKLSRIELAPAEESALSADLQNILKYVEEINAANVVVVDKTPLPGNLREDANPDKPGDSTRDLLAAAETKNGFIKVKKVL
jgi:aspartyl/glutamyl-tRNA(Asn/Gln) amidotransferase C subunit